MLAACLIDFPRFMIQIFRIPAPPIPGDAPLLLLVILPLMLLEHVRACSRYGKPFLSISRSDLIVVLPVVAWMVLELNGLVSVQEVDFSLSLHLLWLVLMWFVLKSVVIDRGRNLFFFKVTVDVLCSLLLFMTLGWFLRAPGLGRLFNFLGDDVFGGWNGLSLLCAMVAGFLLFCGGSLYPRRGLLVRIGLLGIQPYLNHSRSAMLLLCAVGAIKAFDFLVRVAINRRSTPLQRFLVSCLIVVTPLASLYFMFPVVAAAYGNLMRLSADPVAVIASGSDVHSAASRYFSTLEILRRFAEAPFLGNSYAAVRSIKVFGYVCHTLWAVVLSSYGLTGLLVTFFLLANPVIRRVVSSGLDGILLVSIVGVCVISSTTNDFWLWYLIPAILLGPCLTVKSAVGSSAESK